MQKILLILALALGALITIVDTRPTWDDAGVTAGALLVGAAALGFLSPKRPWRWALAVGLWIPLLGVLRTQNYGTLLALVVSLVGAYGGALLRRRLGPRGGAAHPRATD